MGDKIDLLPPPLGKGWGGGSPLANVTQTSAPQKTIVLDTNIVLDVFVFNDPAAEPIRSGLAEKQLDWLSTQPMRNELARVLTYPNIAGRLAFCKLASIDVLANFDRYARLVAVAPKASVTCSDADDQKFIDLAVQHRAMLLSKDKAVLSMKKRLLAQAIHAQVAL